MIVAAADRREKAYGGGVDEVVDALRDQLDELDTLVSGLDDTGWVKPSACPGWSVADVLVIAPTTLSSTPRSVPAAMSRTTN